MIVQDLRWAVRALGKSPGFTGAAVLTLGLGIGANTAIFSVVNTVLLKPLAYQDPDRIVALNTRWSQTGRQTPRLTGGDLVDIRAQNQVFEAMSYHFGGELGVRWRDRSEFAGAFFVNAGFFRVFGLWPAHGRLFDDGQDGSAVVSLSFAQRNFGGGAEALGQTLNIDSRSYQISGVLPAGFRYPRQADVWLPAPLTPANRNRTAYNYPSVAKLKAGVTLEAAEAQLEAIGARLEAAFPESNRGKSFLATPLRDQLVSPVRQTLGLLMGAVSLVLLIACANVANLLLARATSRTREMAVRAALGAGRWQIVRLLLVESAALAAAGGALGVLLARAATNLLIRLAPANLPRLGEVGVDWPVLGFAAAASLAATLLFGLAPAWQASRVDLSEALKLGGARVSGGGSVHRLRDVLVVAEISVCFALSIGAGLLARSFLALSSVELGYRPEGILVMYAHAPARSLEQHRQASRVFDQIFGELAAIPGVKSVAGAMGLPAGPYGSNGAYAVQGRHTFAPGQKLPEAGFRLSTPGYFATLGIPLGRGRDFTERDQYDAPFVAIISEALARQSFAGEDPIGKRLQCGLDSPNWMTIVGVVGDVRQQSPASPPAPELYMPAAQHPYFANELQVALRAQVDPGSLIPAVRRRMAELYPTIPTKFTTLQGMVAESIATPRFRTLLVGAFAALALALAMVGVYAVMSYLVARRSWELGLRVALGAGPAEVLGLVLGRALALAGAGLALGLVLSLAASRVMANMVFGLKLTDPLTYAVVLAAVALVALGGAAIPAWRGARVDPMTALRAE